MNKKLSALLVCVSLSTPLAANAATDYFLKIDGVKGGSVDIGHKDAIDVLSFNWGLSAPVSTGGGAGTSGAKPTFSDFHWTQTVDSAVPTLFVDAAKGKVHPTATFDLVKAGENPFTYLTMTFSDVILTSLNLSGSSGGDPLVSASFDYSKLKMEVITQNASGSKGTTYTGTWDLKAVDSAAFFTGSPVVFLQLADMGAPVSEAAAAAVPEPQTYGLMLSGMGLVGWMARRKRIS